MIEHQIELEKKMTQCSIDNYRREFNKNVQKDSLGNTKVATRLLSRVLELYTDSIKQYLIDYQAGNPIHSTTAASVISKLDVDSVAYISAKVIMNKINSVSVVQSVYKAIGQAIEDEFKMREFKNENSHYYKTIQEDLNKRGAKANRKKNITTGVFSKRLDFHLDRWTLTEKFHTGQVLVKLFITSTGLVEYKDIYKKGKTIRYLTATKELLEWIESTNEKLELLQPFFLPMVCEPRDWTGIFEGGYLSPYVKRNKLIKNNSREYLEKLKTASMPQVYEAINHLQKTPWSINKRVLDVVEALWEEGKAIAELPDREDVELIPFPYPDRGKAKDEIWTQEEAENIKRWKRETYEIHKTNVKRRSLRILTSQIIRIANQFRGYEKIYFPHQMDFRGRLYPIPVLLQPQGSDLAKGLLQFGEGKELTDLKSLNWFKIHGANVYGYDKESYESRVKWVDERITEILSYAENPLQNRGWTEADKPFQFLAWCFECSDCFHNPDNFKTHIPIQLDGTCNGLQHYSALLRDVVGGRGVNLINSDKPNDIYANVAVRLEEKLNEVCRGLDVRDTSLASAWLSLGINRKLTKRPVMVLPYGGTRLSCREYIQEYLVETYSTTELWKIFNIGSSPTDCVFKVSTWLSKYLWESIQETLNSATVGMDWLRGMARVVNAKHNYFEWLTPLGLLVHQEYQNRTKKEIRTELYGSILKTFVRINQENTLDKQRQVNGICPNFIHSLDASCLMLYLNKCKKAGITSFMTVHDCYGTLAPDTEMSAKLLREAFVEIYKQPILDNFVGDVRAIVGEDVELPEQPEKGELEIEEVLRSEYFFN